MLKRPSLRRTSISMSSEYFDFLPTISLFYFNCVCDPPLTTTAIFLFGLENMEPASDVNYFSEIQTHIFYLPLRLFLNQVSTIKERDTVSTPEPTTCSKSTFQISSFRNCMCKFPCVNFVDFQSLLAVSLTLVSTV